MQINWPQARNETFHCEMKSFVLHRPGRVGCSSMAGAVIQYGECTSLPGLKDPNHVFGSPTIDLYIVRPQFDGIVGDTQDTESQTADPSPPSCIRSTVGKFRKEVIYVLVKVPS